MIKIAFFDTKEYDRKLFDEYNKKYGYEITYYTHSDIEYKYVIDVPARSIYCYKGYYPYNRSSNELSEFQVNEEIDLNDFLPKGVKGNYA